MPFLEMAGSAALAVMIIAAAHAALARTLLHVVANPLRLLRFARDFAECRIETSRNCSSLNFYIVDPRHLRRGLCRGGGCPTLRHLRRRADNANYDHRYPENAAYHRNTLFSVHHRPHFCRSSIK